MGSSEPVHGPCRILDGPKPQPRENERRRPALSALDHCLDLLRPELETTENHEQIMRLGGGERELGDTHLDKRPSGT